MSTYVDGMHSCMCVFLISGVWLGMTRYYKRDKTWYWLIGQYQLWYSPLAKITKSRINKGFFPSLFSVCNFLDSHRLPRANLYFDNKVKKFNLCVCVSENSSSGELLTAVWDICVELQASEFMGQVMEKCTILIWTTERNPTSVNYSAQPFCKDLKEKDCPFFHPYFIMSGFMLQS